MRTDSAPASNAQGEPKARDAVFSAAYGVGPEFVRTFLKTFRAVNQSARLILLVWDREPLRDIANEYGAELNQDRWLCRHIPRLKVRYQGSLGSTLQKRVRVTELLGRSTRLAPKLAPALPETIIRTLVSLAVARFFHIRDIPAREDFGQVLLSDSRDVFFQADPFASFAELELAQEVNKFGAERFNDTWMGDGFGDEVLSALRGHHVFCSGTILGSRKGVLNHLKKMCRCVRELRTWRHGGIDQAIHNFVVSRPNEVGQYTISTNDHGRIATLSMGTDVRIQDGYVTDADGRPIPIVHQYDRVQPDVLKSFRMLQT